jgi:hypothetical protein
MLITTDNYDGQLADITFYPCSGGTINIGEVTLPYNYLSGYYYGTYNIYFPDFDKTCTLEVPCLTPTPTPTNVELPIICFTYQGIYNPGTSTFSCEVTAENTLFGGKKWWSLTSCPVNGTPPFSCPTDTGAVWWDSGSSLWRFTSTLGGGTYYSNLNNFGEFPIQIIGLYDWVNDIVGTCSPEMLNSFLGPCVPTSPTPTSTPTPTPTPTNIVNCLSSVVPPAIINGVTITDSSTGAVLNYSTTETSCGITTPVNSKWLGFGGVFSYTMNFSIPINNILIFIAGTGWNFGPEQENFVFTTNTGSGIPSITTTDSCYTTIVGNQILSGGAPIGGAGGKFVITNSTDFTSLTITGNGGYNGSVLSVCANSIQPILSPTPTPTLTPTNTMTPTPTPTTKVLYYVYLECGTKAGPQNSVLIQPMPAVVGNMIGDAILGNGKCWSLIDISNNSLSQLQNLYPDNSYFDTNYFTQVFGSPFVISEDSTACENCLKYAEEVGVTPQDCNIELRNYSNCAEANTSGAVYVNSNPTPVYSFDVNFDVNDVLQLIPVSVGDTITIVLTAPINSSCTLDVSDTNSVGNIFTDSETITNTTTTYSYVTYCGGAKSIEIFSSCLPPSPSLTPTNTITPTPTPTTTPPDCGFILLLDINRNVQQYFSLTNTTIPLFTSVYNGLDLAHSNNKLWVNTSFNIYEYNITLSPWSQTYNRTISTGSVQTGNALGKLPGNNNKLVTVDVSRSPGVIVELDITNPTATSVDIVTLPPGAVTPGDLIITDTIQPKILINLTSVTSGANGLYQYDYNTGAFEIYVPLGAATGAFGIFEENNLIYLINGPGQTYSLSPTSPYTVTFVQTIPTTNIIVGASQLSECTKIILT